MLIFLQNILKRFPVSWENRHCLFFFSSPLKTSVLWFINCDLLTSRRSVSVIDPCGSRRNSGRDSDRQTVTVANTEACWVWSEFLSTGVCSLAGRYALISKDSFHLLRVFLSVSLALSVLANTHPVSLSRPDWTKQHLSVCC